MTLQMDNARKLLELEQENQDLKVKVASLCAALTIIVVANRDSRKILDAANDHVLATMRDIKR